MKTCDSDVGTRPRGRREENASAASRLPAFMLHLGRIVGDGRRALCAAVLLGGLLSGCAYYGFTGASIPSHLETIAIPIAEDNTSSPISNLGRDLTGILTDRFVGRTSFSLDNNETSADAVLQTRITGYSNRPTGVSGDEQATVNEVRIRVQARYYDQLRDSTMVDQSFTGTATYDPAEAGLTGEQQAAQVALERVGEDIFTTATSDW